MRHAKTPVREYMTHLPEEVEGTCTAAEAADRMKSLGVHHLRVMSGAKLLGVLRADRVHTAIAHGATEAVAAELCAKAPLVLAPDLELSEAAAAILDRGEDYALIEDAGVTVGIFTSVDALRALRDGR